MQLKFFLIADEHSKKEAPLRVAKRRFFFPANDSCLPEEFPRRQRRTATPFSFR